MSMQIAAKVTRVVDRVVHKDFEEKTDMHFGDVEFLKMILQRCKCNITCQIPTATWLLLAVLVS
jgi:hypothetical protein